MLRQGLVILWCLLTPGCVIVQVGVTNPVPGLSTVAVAPFFNLSHERAVDGRRFASAYFAELQKVPGFQVLPVGVTEQAIFDNRLEMNNPDDVLKLARILDVDAVVVGAVTDYDPYYPPRVGLQVSWYSPQPWTFHPGIATDPQARPRLSPWKLRWEQVIPGLQAKQRDHCGGDGPACDKCRPNKCCLRGANPCRVVRGHSAGLDGEEADLLDNGQPVSGGAEEPEEAVSGPSLLSASQTPPAMFSAPAQRALSQRNYDEDVEDESRTGSAGQLAPPRRPVPLHPPEQNRAETFGPGQLRSPVAPGMRDTPVVEPQPVPWPEFNPRRPLMSYTRLFDGADADLVAMLRDHVELSGDRRSGGWEAWLHRSEDFLRFTSHLMIVEMLTLHGGEGKRRVVFKLRKFK